ncbi:hypothetical protein PILCRDRAFT_184759 [Piloderma croceum F 1598]|uniref:Uncharacterized protein n=1 Tax=Piloderma croceum (strain F 1598) TaxID=765440 RepID=A0A0C3BVA9_PILCF|nr:hypothetical protein PILCRDRAFT_184759 [Piloderma croceum F 1598]
MIAVILPVLGSMRILPACKSPWQKRKIKKNRQKDRRVDDGDIRRADFGRARKFCLVWGLS